jgi:hypothetical protein
LRADAVIRRYESVLARFEREIVGVVVDPVAGPAFSKLLDNY